MQEYILQNIIEVERGALLTILFTYSLVFFTVQGEKARRREKRLRGLSGAMMLFILLEFVSDCAFWWPEIAAKRQDPQFLSVMAHIEMLIVPLIYLTVTEITLRRKVTGKIAMLHGLPFVLMTAIGVLIKGIWFEYVYYTLLIAYVGVCVVFFIKAINRYEQFINNEYSDLYGLSIRWMKYIFYSLLVIFIIYIMHNAFYTTASRAMLFAAEICLWATIGHNIYLMINARENALKPIRIHTGEENEEQDESAAVAQETAEQKAASIEATKEAFSAQLTTSQREDMERFSERLHAICEEGKLYKKEDLTRDELANELGLNHTYFTRMLKASRGQSFYDYINGLRMEEAAKLLNDPQYPLEAIPYEVGYRHKSTYYRAFSEHFGCTPKEYRKKSARSN